VNYTLHLAAEAEHLQHAGYYRAIRPSLAAQYLADFESTVDRICEAPNRFRIERPPNLRVVSLLKFPYFVVYRDIGSSVQVLAVPHFRQRPGYWAGRL
jgi:plasmid stabilization system protein ParE